MPEGDSVYQLARRLAPALRGRRLARGELRVPAHASDDLAGHTVVGLDTHGKHLLTRFDSGLTLHTHLKMKGPGRWSGPGAACRGPCCPTSGCCWPPRPDPPRTG